MIPTPDPNPSDLPPEAWANAPIPPATAVDILLWVLRRRKRFRVSGPSMLPSLKPDEEVLVDLMAYRAKAPKPGDVVVVDHPQQPGFRLIKRVITVLDAGVRTSELNSDQAYWIEGDNPLASTDSRTFGPVSREVILGRVTSYFL